MLPEHRPTAFFHHAPARLPYLLRLISGPLLGGLQLCLDRDQACTHASIRIRQEAILPAVVFLRLLDLTQLLLILNDLSIEQLLVGLNQFELRIQSIAVNWVHCGAGER